MYSGQQVGLDTGWTRARGGQYKRAAGAKPRAKTDWVGKRLNEMTAEGKVDLLLLQYAQRMTRMRLDPRSINGFMVAATNFQGWLSENDLTMGAATSWELEEYFAQLPFAPTTKRLRLAQIRAAYRYAVRRGAVERDPTFDVRIEKSPDREPHIISSSEMREVKARIRTTGHERMFYLLAYTGMRRSECRNLAWENVNLQTQTIKCLGKGGKLRKIPIHPVLGEVLNRNAWRLGSYVLQSRDSNQISDGTFHAWLSEITGAVQAPPHSWRRTVASSLYRNGVQTDTIDRILGWAPREVRSRYYVNFADDQLHTAISRLYADDPI